MSDTFFYPGAKVLSLREPLIAGRLCPGGKGTQQEEQSSEFPAATEKVSHILMEQSAVINFQM